MKKKKNSYNIEFEGKWQATLNVIIKSVSENGARQKFRRDWKNYKLLNIYKGYRL